MSPKELGTPLAPLEKTFTTVALRVFQNFNSDQETITQAAFRSSKKSTLSRPHP